jgi:DNA modification methylase
MPTWGQLMLPLLDTLAKTGPLKAKVACDTIAQDLNLHPDIRDALGSDSLGRQFNLFDRRLRWVRQSAVGFGFVESPQRGIWSLTQKGEEIAAGKNELGRIHRGTVVTLFSTNLGKFVWGYAEDIAAEIENQSVHLLFTSPPYPLHRKKEYGNLNGANYLDWLEDLLGIHLEKLAPNGAMLINLGEAYETRGSPEISTYREELIIRARKNLGLQFFGKYYWHNPCKPPSGHWVTHAKCKPKNDTEEILWLAKENPQFFGAEARTPYSKSMLRGLKEGGDKRGKRPSGHGDSKNGFATDHGGAWPGQMIQLPNADSQGPYFDFCRKNNLPTHPARFPIQLAERMILTHTEKDQLVYDPFGGSGTTGQAAEKLERRWLSGDRELAYGLGALGRFQPVQKHHTILNP